MRVVFLTGAGISAESGLPTFRGEGGWWRGYRATELATPEAFRRNPELVHEFYNFRRRMLLSPKIVPNAAHLAIGSLQHDLTPSIVSIITQNVDDLHERGGAVNVVHLHGELLKARCMQSGRVFPWRGDLSTQTEYPVAGPARGLLRPDVVWFGEPIPHLQAAYSIVAKADWFITVGSSGVVWPAAGLIEDTPRGCRKILVNLEGAANSGLFDECRIGKATEQIPEICDEIRAAAL